MCTVMKIMTGVLHVCHCSSVALDEFLKRNQLSHVIRAHECMAAGFQVDTVTRVHTHTPL